MTVPLLDRKQARSPAEFDAQFERVTVVSQDSDPLVPSQQERTETTAPGLEQPLAGIPAGYEFLAALQGGHMGVLYRVWQTKLKRDVALKLLPSGAQATAEERARFRTEAEAIACLHHPNIVEVYDYDECAGQPFIAMEFVHGGNLEQKLKGQPLPPREAARLVETLARAMHYAHERHIIHRDLKPANILLDGNVDSPLAECVPKIADFGLAKQLDSENGQTQSSAVLGTPSYMAPEQANPKLGKVGPATDVYALGAILYELLTGRAPFLGASVAETLRQVADDDPVPPTRLQPQTPRDLETICLKCLQKEPARRYATALELADDLRRFLEGRPVTARRIGVVGRTWRWSRRNPFGAALALTVLLGIVVCGWLWFQAVESGREAEEGFRRTRRLLSDFVEAGNSPWQQVGEWRRKRRAALEEASGQYRELCRARPANHELRGELAEVLTALAEVALAEEDYETSAKAAEEALVLWKSLPGQAPTAPRGRIRRADALANLALAQGRLGHSSEMLSAFWAAVAAYQRLADEAPEDVDRLLAVVAVRDKLLTQLTQLGRADGSQSLMEENRHCLTAYLNCGHDSALVRLTLVEVLCRLGVWYSGHGDRGAAVRCWREGCRWSVGVADALPKSPGAWFYPTWCARHLPATEPGALLPEAALASFEQAARLQEATFALTPDDPQTTDFLVYITSTLAECYFDAGRPLDALRTERRAADIRPARPAQSPVLEMERLQGIAKLARREEQVGQHAAAQDHAREVADGFETFCRGHEEEPVLLRVAVDYCSRLAPALRHAGATDQSRRLVERALQLAQELVRAHPDAVHLRWLDEAWVQLAKCCMRDDPGGVEAALTEAVAVTRRLVVLDPENRFLLDDRLRRLARQQGGNGQRKEAAACLRECATLWPDNAEGLRGVARNYRALAEEMNHWWMVLLPAERNEQQGYVAEAVRLEKSAEALRRKRE